MINFWIKGMAGPSGMVQAGIDFFCLLCSAGGHKKWVTVRFPLDDSYHSCSLIVWFTPMKTLCNEKLPTWWNHKLGSFFLCWFFFFPFFYCSLTSTTNSQYLRIVHRFFYCALHKYANISSKWSLHFVLILRDLFGPFITSLSRSLWCLASLALC